MPLCIPPRRAALVSVAIAALLLSGCSTSQLVARGAAPLIDNGVTAMNRETDLELARASIPANLKMIEALLLADPGNVAYRVQAAMGFYGYAMGFVEADHPGARRRPLSPCARSCAGRARSCRGDAGHAHGRCGDVLEQALAKLDARAVPALFWTASSVGKLDRASA